MRAADYYPWADQTKIDRLVALREQGLPFSAIAAQFGTTKNAVIGKFRRVEAMRAKEGRPIKVPAQALSNRNGHGKPNTAHLIGARWKNHTPVAALPPELPVDVVIPESKRVTLADVRHGECRWVLGDTDGPDTVFCGAPVMRRSFCAGHLTIAFYKPNRAKPSLTNRIKKPFRLQNIGAK